MTTFTLDEPPAGVGADRWLTDAPADPAVGDLWLLSWDGVGLGLGVISARHDGFVLIWPVSVPSDPVAPPALAVADSPLGVPLFPWPSRETGVGDALLHRRLGTLLSPLAMARTAEAFDEGSEPPLPFASSPVDDTAQAALAYSVELVGAWERICLLQWPSLDQESRLDPDAMRDSGLAPSAVADALGIDTADAVAVFLGQSPVTRAQLEALAAASDARPEDLLDQGAPQAAALRLISPRRKEQVLQVAARLGLREGAARDRVVREFALAARSSGGVEQRLDGVFARLLAQG